MHTDEEFLESLGMCEGVEAHLVYADWLEENGDARSQYLRLEVELSQMEPTDPGFVKKAAERKGNACRHFFRLATGGQFVESG